MDGRLSEDQGAPKRRIEMMLTLGADNWDEVARALDNLSIDIQRGDHRYGDGFSVGWASSYSISVTEDPAQSGDKYREENEAYVAAKHPDSVIGRIHARRVSERLGGVG